jgi:hypothetical protein
LDKWPKIATIQQMEKAGTMSEKRAESWTMKGCLAIAMAIGLVGRERSGVKVYEVPEEQSRAQDEVIEFSVPAGWREMPGSGPTGAAFAISTTSGSRLEASFRKFNDMSGSEAFVLNMIRGEAQLAEITDENLVREAMSSIRIGDSYGMAFEATGREKVDEFQGKMRTIVAMLHRGGVTWFFKYTGNVDESKKSESTYRDWLAGLKFVSSAQGSNRMMTGTGMSGGDQPVQKAAESENSGMPNWQLPEGWVSQSPGSMVLARFSINGAAGQAEVTISRFPGDVGGLVPNLNRWRRQVNLGPLSGGDVGDIVTEFQVDGNGARLIDMSEPADGQNQGLIAVWDFRSGEDGAVSWFYKLQGEFSTVQASRSQFLSFIESIKY